MKLYRHVAAIFLATLLLTIPAVAQTFGEITGRVSDSTGASVPGASITLTSISTNASRATVSTESGDYTPVHFLTTSVPPSLT